MTDYKISIMLESRMRIWSRFKFKPARKKDKYDENPFMG